MEHLRHIAVWWPARRVRVAGFPVCRMTLGHLRVLEAMGSPMLCGGKAGASHCADVIAVLGLSWRVATALAPHAGLLAAIARPIARAISRAPGTAQAVAQISAYINLCLWQPEAYVLDGSTPRAFAPAFGLAVTLAMRAARLPLQSISARPRRLVWDYPLDEIMMWLSCDDEINGREFQNAADLDEMVAPGAGLVRG